MTLLLGLRHLEAVHHHGEADYPREACGLIGGTIAGDRKIAVETVPLRNARTDALRNRFLIDPEAFRRAQARLDRDGLEVIGVYHSHPDHPAAPSAYDRAHAWPWLSYLILEVRRGKAWEAKSWVLADDRSAFQEEAIEPQEGMVA